MSKLAGCRQVGGIMNGLHIQRSLMKENSRRQLTRNTCQLAGKGLAISKSGLLLNHKRLLLQ